jgi:hypothetical protein
MSQITIKSVRTEFLLGTGAAGEDEFVIFVEAFKDVCRKLHDDSLFEAPIIANFANGERLRTVRSRVPGNGIKRRLNARAVAEGPAAANLLLGDLSASRHTPLEPIPPSSRHHEPRMQIEAVRSRMPPSW